MTATIFTGIWNGLACIGLLAVIGLVVLGFIGYRTFRGALR